MNPVRPTKWFYTYILMSQKDREFYTGVTDNLNRRLEQHNRRAGLLYETEITIKIDLF